MSRRGQNNDVRGPTSALTSFLREQGITVPNANRFQRARQQPEPVQEEQPQAPASTDEASESQPARPAKRPAEEDEDEEEAPVASSSKRKKSTSTTAAQKAKAKKAAALDAELADLGDNASPPKSRYADRTPGSFASCLECGVKFTITKYTRSLPDGGVLCPPCLKEFDAVNGANDSQPAKKKARAVKPKPQPLEKPKPVIKSLQTCCIELIGKNIDAVDDFGDVGAQNLERICKIVCKNRGLNEQTVKLFLDMSATSLSLYDCARLDQESYEMITRFSPKLRSIILNFCGSFKDPAIELFQERMTKLVRIELFGAFLVNADKWISYFDSFLAEGRDPLEGFLLRQSPRFNDSCIIRLAENFPNLRELRLSEIQQLNDASLKHLQGLKALTSLDISRAGLTATNLTDDGIVLLLEHIGKSLQVLDISENERVTDRTLYEGPGGVTATFKDWSANVGLEALDISRCLELDDESLAAILDHSGSSLIELDMNSVDKVTDAGLKNLIGSTPKLQKLDIGFVRAVDDFLLKDILENCGQLERVSVFGCNRITDMAPHKSGVAVLGEGTCQFYR